ncbi:hypothetical protein AOLI_G00225890 [Acnodon oligacanthus]
MTFSKACLSKSPRRSLDKSPYVSCHCRGLSCVKGTALNMNDCLHTSAENLSKLVKWAHSHGTICTLIPNLKHLLTEGAHGSLTALWGCNAGHAYHWPLMSSCKTTHKERMLYQSSRGISSDTLLQSATAMQSSSAERFLGSGAKNKGDSNQTQDSCDFSNCSEPSEMDDNAEEYNNHLFDIVCESSATDEEGDSEPRATDRKRGPKGPASGDCGDTGAKKIKQERAEDYYTVANAQIPGGSEGPQPCSGVSHSPRPNSQTRPSSISSAHHRPSSMDGDSVGVSSSPLENVSPSVAKPPHAPVSGSQSRTHMNSHPAASQSAASTSRPGKSDLVESLPNGDFEISFEDASVTGNPEMDILAEQALGAEAKGDGTGCLAPSSLNSEEHFWPSTSEFSPNAERHSEDRKELEEFITTIDPITLQNLQAVISRVLVIHERSRVPEASPPRLGVQELFPGCGLYLPTSKLATMHQESRQDSMRLFHLLFEHFFSEEDLIGAVAFGKRGKVPDGKKILDRRTVDGIIAYVLHCSSLEGWTSVESAKLKKACINKCRLRIVPFAMYEIEKLKALLQAERSKSVMLGETISSLKQDKELLQQELSKKAELICEFLQDQLRPEKRRGHPSSQMEAGSSHQLIGSFPEEGAPFEPPALFDSFEEVELHPLDRQRTIKISSKRSRDGENTRVRMKNVVGVIARYMTALQEFRRSVSMKVAFDRVGVDRNTISRTAAIAELSLAAPEVFHALPPWDEKEETLAHYASRCKQAMDDSIKAKIKAMKAKGELLPIVSK